jgi:iron complex transport system substrate-binding protein
LKKRIFPSLNEKVFCFFFSKRKYFLPSLFLIVAHEPAYSARVVSLNLCTDALLVKLAPERVSALSPLARDPTLSPVAAEAALLPWVRPDAEAVLRLRPDMVLAGEYGAQAALMVLRARGVRVVQVSEPTDFGGVAREVGTVAAALGVARRGAAMVTDMRARLGAIHVKARGQAIFWEARGYTAGPGSFADTLLRRAGFADVGNGRVVGLETMLMHPPDVLVTAQAPAFPSLSTDMLSHPALATIKRMAVPPALVTCPGPWSVGAVEILSK